MLTKQEIRQLGSKEMMEELQKSRRELLKSQFEIRSGASKEVHTAKNLKKYIARLQTITQEAKPSVASTPSDTKSPAKAKKAAKKASTKSTKK